MRTHTPYNDDYPTCAYTHAWLRIMSENLDPDEVTSFLAIKPTKEQRRGEFISSDSKKRYKTSGWFLSTKGILDSLDLRVHLDWILDQVENKKNEFHELIKRKYLVDVCVRWDSRSGHGGPTLSPKHLSGFGDLGVEVWFDVYFFDDEDENL